MSWLFALAKMFATNYSEGQVTHVQLHGIEITYMDKGCQAPVHYLIEVFREGVLLHDVAEIHEHEAFTTAAALAAEYNLPINYSESGSARSEQ